MTVGQWQREYAWTIVRLLCGIDAVHLQPRFTALLVYRMVGLMDARSYRLIIRAYQRMSHQGKENVLPPTQRTRRTIKVRPHSRTHLAELNQNDNMAPSTPEHEGREKLLELTSQCVTYFHRFANEKDAQLAVVAKAFQEIAAKVEAAFGEVIAQAQRKMQQISSFLQRERERLQAEKRGQEEELNGLLKEIQQVHLTRILKEEDASSKEVLAEYAETLEKFFNVMMEVEKNCYEDSVEECVSFVNNLIREELRTILSERPPPRVEDFVGTSPDPCFTFDGHPLDDPSNPSSLFAQTPSALQELKSIGQRQKQQAQRLSNYCSLLVKGDPFSGVDLVFSPR